MIYIVFLVGRLTFCGMILFVLFRQASYLNLREENVRLQIMMEQQQSQYAIAKENINQINIKAHDIKHFVDFFHASGKIPEDLLTSLDNVSRQYENVYDTGNKALDITLSEKTKRFYEENIEFSAIMDGMAVSFMSDVDIYVLIGNLLDNAREAVLAIEDVQSRIIALHLQKTEQGVVFHAENKYAYRPNFIDGLPQTNKQDEVNHGFGTKSIRAIVQKYNGHLQMFCDDQLFKVNIIFFSPDQT
jgi:hypothetical protein